MGRAVPYSAAEENFLRGHAATPRRVLTELFCEEFGRKDITVDHIKSKCFRMGLKTGRSGCFEKGAIPANKGQRGVNRPGSRKTQFKKGGQPHNAKPVGYERLCSKNGYVMIKVAQPNPYTGAKTRMMPKHRWIWEQAHGPIPKGHVVRFIDGDPTHWQLENLICVPLSVNARLNVKGYNDAPPELRASLLAAAQLEDRIGQIEPSVMQRQRAKPNFKKQSRAAPPAAHLRELIVEDDLVDILEAHGAAVDRAIALAYPDKSWALDLSEILPADPMPADPMPAIVHLDWRRAKKRPDILNRIREFWPEGLPQNVRYVR